MAKENTRKDPKEYMRIAVDVMKKSIEERKNNKPSPYVGAVLVFPDGSYDTAYRGELREGDHAEYTLLDKKNRNRKLSDCWLFATLEPCAPGARNAPKISCSERIVNARISEVWFGIEDKNPTVDHGGINHMEEYGIKVHQFAPEFHKEIEDANKEFMKWANIKNNEAKIKKENPQDYLDKQASETNLSSLSTTALQKFITESKRNYNHDSDEFLQELKEMELLEFDKSSNSYLPTGNAILLFGKNPRNKFPQAAIKAKVNYGNGETGTETFSDALVLVPDEVDNWLKKVLPASIDRSNFKAKQITSFPIPVIREAIINAIAHRDYTKEGAKIQLDVFPDRIIVKSPGKPVLPITIEALKNFTATSYSRNKKLTFIFNEMEYMEESSLGMDTFKSLREKYELPLPIIDYDGSNVVVTFPRTIDVVREVSGIVGIEELNDEEIKGYEWIKLEREVSARQYATHFDYGYKKAQRHLAKMTKVGLIGDNGEAKTSPNYKYVPIDSGEDGHKHGHSV
ncbi:MAG: ATP-binding protein [Bacteroidales bacterium]|nr:ATP-binding protein [Bacteroidales bacterium]